LNTFIKEAIPGMAELESRIDCIASLLSPDYDDKKFICVQEGVKESAIVNIVNKSSNFRTLFREINNHKNDIPSRYESEWDQQPVSDDTVASPKKRRIKRERATKTS
jgi:hypothetical protein